MCVFVCVTATVRKYRGSTECVCKHTEECFLFCMLYFYFFIFYLFHLIYINFYFELRIMYVKPSDPTTLNLPFLTHRYV